MLMLLTSSWEIGILRTNGDADNIGSLKVYICGHFAEFVCCVELAFRVLVLASCVGVWAAMLNTEVHVQF